VVNFKKSEYIVSFLILVAHCAVPRTNEFFKRRAEWSVKTQIRAHVFSLLLYRPTLNIHLSLLYGSCYGGTRP
jgi:hypothetical protein